MFSRLFNALMYFCFSVILLIPVRFYGQEDFKPEINLGGRLQVLYGLDYGFESSELKHGFLIKRAKVKFAANVLPNLAVYIDLGVNNEFYAQKALGGLDGKGLFYLDGASLEWTFYQGLTFAVGQLFDNIVREYISSGNLLFVNSAGISDDYQDAIIAMGLYGSHLEGTLSWHFLLGNADAGLVTGNLNTLGRYAATFALAYSPFGWENGKEWLNSTDEHKLSVSLGFAVKNTDPQVIKLYPVIDFGYAYNLFYMYTAFFFDVANTQDDTTIKLKEFGTQVDLAFTAIDDLLVPAIRYVYQSIYREEKDENMRLAVVFNVYPYKKAHTFKIQPELNYIFYATNPSAKGFGASLSFGSDF